MATILIVDPNPLSRKYLVSILGFCGHTMLEADGAEAGLAMARAECPDLVVLDFPMPTMYGSEILSRFRAAPTTVATPVIVFTDRDHKRETQIYAEECGICAVLTKPCEPELVFRIVRAALTRIAPPVFATIASVQRHSLSGVPEHANVRPAAIANRIQDIAKWKHTVEELQQSRERLRDLIAVSPVVFCKLAIEARSLRIAWVSENVREITGYSADEVLHHDWWDGRMHPEESERVPAEIVALLSSGHSTCEYRLRHRDGSFRWIRSESRLHRGDAGGPGEIVASWLDITDRRHLEDLYRQSQKMEAVGRLVGGVAHDFNNLLTVINGYGELALEKLRPGDSTRDMVRAIAAAGDKAAGLVRQLLAFSRNAVVEPKPLDLRTVVADVEKMLGRFIREDIQFAVVADAEIGAVLADPGQIHQVLLNLVLNARDAMPHGGRLTIELRNVEATESQPDARPVPHVRLSVVDTGCGMDSATIAQVFEPFFTTKGHSGTGIGLATVHSIVRQSGGYLTVESEVGRGTAMNVYLPRIEERPAAVAPHAPQVEMPRGSETILLVEDEDGVRSLARHVLLDCGYTVLEANDGVEAIRIANLHPSRIDLLIADVILPRIGGREVAEYLAKTHSGVRILFVSGYAEDDVEQSGIFENDVAFLNKPFTPSSLAEKVRNVLG